MCEECSTTDKGTKCLEQSQVQCLVKLYFCSVRYARVRNEKIEINETNRVPNQYTEYLNLILKQPNELSQLFGFQGKN